MIGMRNSRASPFRAREISEISWTRLVMDIDEPFPALISWR